MWISSWVQVEVVRFNWWPEAIWSHHFPQGVQSPSAGPLRGSDQSFCRDSEGQDQAEPKQFALGKNHWLSSTWHVPWSNLTMAPWKKPPSFKTWWCLSRICSYFSMLIRRGFPWISHRAKAISTDPQPRSFTSSRRTKPWANPSKRLVATNVFRPGQENPNKKREEPPSPSTL